MSDNDETSVLPKIVNPEDAETIQEVAKALRKALDVGGRSGKYIADVLGTFPKDLVGLLLGDPISYARFRARAWYDKKVAEILKQRGIWGKTKPVSPSIAIPLLQAAQDETREELRELWASLIANAMDPNRSNAVRRNIIEAVKQFEPLDAVMLKESAKTTTMIDSTDVAAKHGVRRDEVTVSFMHLHTLNCVQQNFKTDSFGREVLRACSLDEK